MTLRVPKHFQSWRLCVRLGSCAERTRPRRRVRCPSPLGFHTETSAADDAAGAGKRLTALRDPPAATVREAAIDARSGSFEVSTSPDHFS
jgi:hypothetical protein